MLTEYAYDTLGAYRSSHQRRKNSQRNPRVSLDPGVAFEHLPGDRHNKLWGILVSNMHSSDIRVYIQRKRREEGIKVKVDPPIV